jgi:DNA-directed RNA polymerase subunit E'/Rpb7
MNTDNTIDNSKQYISKSLPQKKNNNNDIYSQAIITKTCYIPIIYVGSNIKDTLHKDIASNIEGKCISEGYIKPDSVKIITYSSGVVNGSNISFEVVFECSVCNPVEGMHINCIAKNITKAGIRAELNVDPSPIIIFVARDHNYVSKSFSSIEVNQEINVRVIGQRFELNDKYISIIGELVITSKSKSGKTLLPTLDIED